MNRSILLLLGATVLLASCEKNARQDPTEPPAGGAAVKFFNFAVGAPQVNFYVNDTKYTGVGATTGTPYGGAGSGGWYNDIAPGQYTLKAQIANTTDFLGSAAAAIGADKKYSYYLSGVYDAAAKTADAFVVEDALPAWDYANGNVRFVNAIWNSGSLTLYAKNTITGVEVPVGGSVAYKAGGAFVALPPGSYNLRVRASGAATDLVVRAGVSFSAQRAYTITARGDAGSTVTANKPALDNTQNR